MKRAPLVFMAISLGLTGCLHHTHRRTITATPYNPIVFSNAQTYDRYVATRTDELISQGRSRRDAVKTAQKEATKRWGNRTTFSSETETVVWPPPKSNTISYAELDAAIGRSRR